MAKFIYIAKRNLVPGHTVGQQYEVNADVENVVESIDESRTQQASLSGLLETVYFRSDKVWTFDIGPLGSGRRDNWREFLESTAGGEPFNFDPETIVQNAPAITVPLVRVGEGYTFTPVGQKVTRVQFQAREVG